MALRPDSDPPSAPESVASDRGLWIALAVGSATIAALALAVRLVLAPGVHAPGAGKPPANPARNPVTGPAPLMSRPQLLESQQAMPELVDFDAQNPPPNPINGGPLGSPGAPSSLGTGVLGQ